MYEEWQVIDGVLCRRGSPSGEWQIMTPEHITQAYCDMEKENKKMRIVLKVAIDRLAHIKTLITETLKEEE